MEHLKLIKQYFDKHFPLFPEVEEILNMFEVKVYPKKKLLLAYGKVDKEVKFVNKGIVREYYMTDGNEVNIDFYSENYFLTNFTSFYTNTPSLRYHESLTEVEIVVLPKEALDAWLKKYPEGKTLIETSFKRILLANEIRDVNLVTRRSECVPYRSRAVSKLVAYIRWHLATIYTAVQMSSMV